MTLIYTQSGTLRRPGVIGQSPKIQISTSRLSHPCSYIFVQLPFEISYISTWDIHLGCLIRLEHQFGMSTGDMDVHLGCRYPFWDDHLGDPHGMCTSQMNILLGCTHPRGISASQTDTPYGSTSIPDVYPRWTSIPQRDIHLRYSYSRWRLHDNVRT